MTQKIRFSNVNCENNPVYRLGEQVLRGKLALAEALEQVAAEGTLTHTNDATINQLDDCIRELAEQDLAQATVLAVLNCQAARYKGSDLIWGHCNLTLGWLYLQRDELEPAFQHYCEALKVFEPLPEAQETVARIRHDMGEIMERQENLEAAVEQYEQALYLAEKLKLSYLECDARNGLGRIYLTQEQVDAALDAFQEALKLSQESGDERGQETSLGNIGQAYHFLGRLAEAEEHYQLAIAFSEKTNHQAGKGRLLNTLGNVLIERGKLGEAEACLQEALDIARQRQDRYGEQQRLGNLGNLYQAKAKREADPQLRKALLVEAEEYHRNAVAIARERKDWPNQAIHLLNQGRAYTSLGCFEASETCFAEALCLAEDLEQGVVDTQWRVHYAWGNLCTAQRLDRPAFDHYTAAIEIVEKQRRELRPESRSAFWQERTALYKQTVLCCLRLDELWPALAYTEQAKARYLADLLAQHSSPTDDAQAMIKVTLRKLPLHTAVVLFNVTEAGTVLFIVADQPAEKESSMSKDDWQQSSDGRIRVRLVDGFNQDTLQRLLVEVDGSGEIVGGYLGDYYTNHTRWQESTLEVVSNEIYKSLLALVHQELTRLQVERIVFMPNLGLSLLPLHACGTERSYLLDHYQITYAPSFDVLRHCQLKASSEQPSEGPLLAVSNPTGDLMWADAEVKHIASLFPNARVLNDGEKDRATPEAIITEASDYAFVHFACHGVFDMPNFLNSHLKLASKETLTLKTILEHLKLLRTCLVVMSACETGLVDPADLADEYIGLAAGFLLAGAPAVVASLWAVDDLSTALLMERFYLYHLYGDPDRPAEGPLSPASALRQAQQWLRDVTAGELAAHYEAEMQKPKHFAQTLALWMRFDREDPDSCPFGHPIFWAPFTISGQ